MSGSTAGSTMTYPLAFMRATLSGALRTQRYSNALSSDSGSSSVRLPSSLFLTDSPGTSNALRLVRRGPPSGMKSDHLAPTGGGELGPWLEAIAHPSVDCTCGNEPRNPRLLVSLRIVRIWL